jgi:hypothetical protein
MSYMFKGPASLSDGSVITNATSISTSDLTITDDLTVTDDVSIGDNIEVTGNIESLSIHATISEPVLTVDASVSGTFSNTDITDYNVLYLKSSNASSTPTLNITLIWRVNDGININPINDGHHIFVAWVGKHATNTTITINFNSGSSDPLTIYSSGTGGANARNFTVTGIGQNALFYYSSFLNIWMANKSNVSSTFG